MQTFTESELALYDGSDASKPIYVGLDGDVYDVTAGSRMYGPVSPSMLTNHLIAV